MWISCKWRNRFTHSPLGKAFEKKKKKIQNKGKKKKKKQLKSMENN